MRRTSGECCCFSAIVCELSGLMIYDYLLKIDTQLKFLATLYAGSNTESNTECFNISMEVVFKHFNKKLA